MRKGYFIVLAVLTLLASGCDLLFQSCETDGRYAISVTVVDSVSGARLPDALVMTGVARDGAYADSIATSANFTADFAAERPGTYSVRLTVDGYEPWSREGVVVQREGDCRKLRTVQLTARLRRTDGTQRVAWSLQMSTTAERNVSHQRVPAFSISGVLGLDRLAQPEDDLEFGDPMVTARLKADAIRNIDSRTHQYNVSLERSKMIIEAWRKEYNEERPHTQLAERSHTG